MSRNVFFSRRPAATVSVLTSVLLGLSLSAAAQTRGPVPTPRILNPVNPAVLTTLKGNTMPLANAANDRGAVPDATPTGRLMLQLTPSADQKAALDTLVAAQQNPKSASFHKWLTPATFGKQFGASDSDIQTITAYLTQQGFAVSRVLPNKLAIEFSGTTGQLRTAFKTEIHSYMSKGQSFLANNRDPQMPTALTSVVSGITSLNNYQPARKALTAQSIPINRKGNKVHADYTDANNLLVAVSPGDLATIYDIPASSTGQGVAVGIVGTSNVNLTYYQNFRTTFALGAYTPSVVIDGDDPGVGKEADLDLIEMELVSAVAPSATINYYTSASADLSTGMNLSLIRAINDDAVQVLILTQENCEANLGVDDNAFLNNAAEFGSALGMTVIAKAGNGGSAECDSGGGDGSATEAAASQGLAINGYASSPYVTAVGATDFYYPPAERNETGLLACCWNATNSGTAGYTSARGYIQEQPWNDSNNTTNGQPFDVLVATGGGVSTAGDVSADGSTSIPYPEPSWQIPVVPAALSKGSRVIPDVSMFGGDAENGSIYMTCVAANECVGGAGGDDETLVYGFGAGTESSSAVFGGVAALVVEAHGAQGSINPTLYSMYKAAPSAFHDVTVGTNTVVCVAGSPNCGASGFIVDSTGASAYSGATGYDAASGLGSVDVGNLITNWAPPNTTTSSTTLSFTTLGTSTPVSTFVHGTPVQINIAVTGSSATPSGDVALIANTAATATAAPTYLKLTNGSVTDTTQSGTFAGGSYTIKANYGGNSVYAASTSASVALDITPESSKVETETLSFTPGSTISYGTPITAQLYVFSGTNPNSIGTPTGSVSVTDAGQQLTVVPLDAQGYATFTAILPVGAHTLGFSYAGDSSYQSSALASNLNVTVNAETTTTTLSSTDSNDGKGDYAQLVAVVSGTSKAGGSIASPAGTITFQIVGSATTLGTVTVVPGTNGSGQLSGIGNLQVKGANLPNNPTSVTATFTPAAANGYATSISNILSITTTSAAKLGSSTTTVATADGAASYFDYDGAVTLNLTVTGSGVQPTGTVSVFDNGVLLGTSTLSGSTATYAINAGDSGLLPLSIGRNVIIAQYNGDAAHATSSKQTIFTILDEGTLPDFSLQTSTTYGAINSNVTTTPFTLQLTSINNFAALGQKVTFTAAVPTGFACTFGAKNVTFSTTATYATNTVSCGLTGKYTISSVGADQRPLKGYWIASGGATLACVFLLGIPARRRQWRSRFGMLALVLLIGLSAGATIGLTGCGSNAIGRSSQAEAVSSADVKPEAAAAKTVAPGIYQVVITATAPFATGVGANTATLQTHTLPLQIVVSE